MRSLRRFTPFVLAAALILGTACSPGRGRAQGPGGDMPSPEKEAEALGNEIQQSLSLEPSAMEVVGPALKNFFLDRQALFENAMASRGSGRPDMDGLARKMEHVVDDAMEAMAPVLDKDQMETVRRMLEQKAAPGPPQGRGGPPGGPGGRGGGPPPGGGSRF